MKTMDTETVRKIVEREIERRDGVLPLRPAFVARSFLCAGRRLALREDQYAIPAQGEVCERWFASETEAENTPPFPNEGLSFLDIEGEDILLRDANQACASTIMGREYASKHRDLGRLAKVFDYGTRLFFHLHQNGKDAAKIGRNGKEEGYYFPSSVDRGSSPETFFGVHPSIVESGRQKEILLPYLRQWDSDLILQHSRAYLAVPGDGFHLPAGILHAPASVLTIELQEASDVAAIFQARVGRFDIPKSMLSMHIDPAEWRARGEESALDLVDWPANADPYFYEHHHTPPVPVPGSDQGGGREEWVYYNSAKFSGKRVVVEPGARYLSRDRGVYTLFVWTGAGRVGSVPVEGQKVGRDELLVVHERAVQGVVIECTGSQPLEAFKFFGPDINTGVVPFLR